MARDPKPSYNIQTATRSELALVLDWAAAEGWNPGLADADCFYAADCNGFWIGLLNGEPIASLSAVKYDGSFGFIGLYIVRPAFRGYGYGLQLWQAGLNYLQGCNIGLDGVLQQQDNYTRSGFTFAHRNIRYQGTGNPLSLQQHSHCDRFLQPVILANNIRLVPLSSVPFTSVIQYDSTLFLAARSNFLQRWIGTKHHVSIGVVNEDQQLLGYGVLRPCQQGYKIGPLFADTPQFAEAIFQALKACVKPGAPFYLDVSEVNPEAVDLAKRHRMEAVFETARMYTHEAPELPLGRIFGITTFELG